MVTLSVISGIIILALLISFAAFQARLKQREKLCKEWKVGDKLILNSIKLNTLLQKNNQNYGILSGCNLTNVFIDIGDSVYCQEWDVIETNKSYNWRTHYQKCQEAMGTNPRFSDKIDEPGETSVSGKIDGKAIELLTEIECQIYLKKSLDEENYELADKIRKQMQKYR